MFTIYLILDINLMKSFMHFLIRITMRPHVYLERRTHQMERRLLSIILFKEFPLCTVSVRRDSLQSFQHFPLANKLRSPHTQRLIACSIRQQTLSRLSSGRRLQSFTKATLLNRISLQLRRHLHLIRQLSLKLQIPIRPTQPLFKASQKIL